MNFIDIIWYNDILPGNVHKKSTKDTQGRIAPLTSLHQTVLPCRKMGIHLDNSIQFQEMHSTNRTMVRFLFSHLSVQEKMLHISIMPFGASTLSLSEAPASIFRNRSRRSSCRHNNTRRLRSVGIGLVQMWCDLFWTSLTFPLRHYAL